MKIYTKTGDKGQTGLYSGKRIPKFHARVEAYGTVDELNAFLGALRDQVKQENLKAELLEQQHHLFALGAALADDRPGEAYQLPADAATNLEVFMDRMDDDLPKMTHFILPGGSPVLSSCHVCRTVCRRAERRVVELADTTSVDQSVLIYLNRLSDYFFVLSRHLAQVNKIEEIKWIP
ncbi:cob(I)yrinic acid a,c-diamide adenosyltransferase [Lewinella sp. 4G2]|uniref:cob(I)yrinic acid a,c-diamide adenosyltransferase n=1 Tax=Lewinella sp. 4G2 TaxID=1803372 RepID=UPI0007B4B85A|nr:cob(I)yrinic acid a,c-diamide adenosyltransferase [Lewinella sp. 4G2]OAV45563.1 ATP:cob(I)alamin adenosyltransferase [Lewinella sp. 4G2]